LICVELKHESTTQIMYLAYANSASTWKERKKEKKKEKENADAIIVIISTTREDGHFPFSKMSILDVPCAKKDKRELNLFVEVYDHDHK